MLFTSQSSLSVDNDLDSSSTLTKPPLAKYRVHTSSSSRTPRTPSSKNTTDRRCSIAAISEGRGAYKGYVGLATMDLRQADIEINEFIDSSTFSRLKMKLLVAEPEEIIVAESFNDKSSNALLLEMIRSSLPNVTVTNVHRRFFNPVRGAEIVTQLSNEEISNCDTVVLQKQFCMQACCALVKYVEHIQNVVFASKTLRFNYCDVEKTCMLDGLNMKDFLNRCWILAKPRDRQQLSEEVDETLTSVGARLLRSNLLQPSSDQEVINGRLDAVEELVENPYLIEKLRQVLGSTYDLDHVFDALIESPIEPTTVQSAEYNLTQLLRLYSVLNVVNPLRQVLKIFKCDLLSGKNELLSDERIDVIKKLLDDRFQSETISGNKKNSLSQRHKKCYAIKDGVSVNLDVARRAYEELLRDIQGQEEELNKLLPGEDTRLAYSKSRGFHYVWVCGNAGSVKVPTIRPSIAVLYHVMDCIATVDFLCSFAVYAFNRETVFSLVTPVFLFEVRPRFGNSIIIKEGRHPLLDYSTNDEVAPNDTYLSPDSRVNIITGPNMTGKSTYLKQVCQLCILAQCGSYVTAKIAVLPVFLRIFSRIGHNDNLYKNLSAFALEMQEMALILQYSDDRTLLVIDELARSTSVEEGISICYAIIEKLLQQKTFTIFATHFLDLAALDINYPQVEKYVDNKSAVIYVDGEEQLAPTHRLEKGPYRGPLYGFELVELSTFPEEVIEAARELSQRLHEKNVGRRTMDPETLKRRTLLRAAYRLRQIIASKNLVTRETLIRSLEEVRQQLRADIPDIMGQNRSSTDEPSA
ncbi:MutS domain V protein [Necator americanus]|uniref:MutS domain V protein n=1 Tax=Necator americanus TaxID=51031 RepID=W2TKX5_NECAM|nr:MutS domain V protein [Necator americanus]ETN82443.1 MutS domain V protein [Necator americanus]